MNYVTVADMIDRKEQKVQVAQGSGVFVKLPNMHGLKSALLARILP